MSLRRLLIIVCLMGKIGAKPCLDTLTCFAVGAFARKCIKYPTQEGYMSGSFYNKGKEIIIPAAIVGSAHFFGHWLRKRMKKSKDFFPSIAPNVVFYGCYTAVLGVPFLTAFVPQVNKLSFLQYYGDVCLLSLASFLRGWQHQSMKK